MGNAGQWILRLICRENRRIDTSEARFYARRPRSPEFFMKKLATAFKQSIVWIKMNRILTNTLASHDGSNPTLRRRIGSPLTVSSQASVGWSNQLAEREDEVCVRVGQRDGSPLDC